MLRRPILPILLFMFGCGNSDKITAPAFTPIQTPTTPTAEYRHPRFTPDSSWVEDNAGMTLAYESADFAKPWSLKTVSDTLETVRAGWKAQRFEVRSGDCYLNDCTRSPRYERTEIAQTRNENVEGDEYWYAWSFYVPANIPLAPWVFLGQFQQYPNHDPIWMFLKTSSGPLCAVFDGTRTNQWSCQNALIENSEFAGRWHDIVVHAKWTVKNDGFTRIYVNGQLKVDYQGYTRTSNNSDVYFKYGIYRMASPVTSVVYYDEVRRGKTREEVDIRLLGK